MESIIFVGRFSSEFGLFLRRIWIVLCTAGPSIWAGAAIDYDVVSYAVRNSFEYDPVIDNPDPESIKTRQIVSSLRE